MQGRMLKAERLGNALKVVLTLNSNDEVLDKVSTYQGKDLNISIKELREKRSLPQNSKLWAIINEIAKAVGSSPNEIYEQMLIKYAPSAVISLAVKYDPADFFKHYSLYKENGKFKAYTVYKGSSQMDTKEMSDFINSVELEAQELGIDTDSLEVSYAKKCSSKS